MTPTPASRPGQSAPAAGRTAPGRRRRRDRHGRGRRGVLAPPQVPLARSRAEQFDDLVLDAVEDLEHAGAHAGWAQEMAALEFAVEDVPEPALDDLSPDVVADKGVVLARLDRGQPQNRAARRARDRGAPVEGPGPVVIVYRRPVEARTEEGEDRADLVFSLVVELVAEFLGRDVEDVDPR